MERVVVDLITEPAALQRAAELGHVPEFGDALVKLKGGARPPGSG